MKNVYLFFCLLLTLAVLTGGCKTEESAGNPVSDQSDNIGSLNKSNSEVQKELALAKSATARYHDLETAKADGYVDAMAVVQHMGYHYINIENWNAFDPGKPALLVYSKNPVNGKMRLVAVEYAVPDEGHAPEGFAGNGDVWEYDPDIDKWECHAWIWYNNPDGIFNKYNSRVQVDDADVNHP